MHSMRQLHRGVSAVTKPLRTFIVYTTFPCPAKRAWSFLFFFSGCVAFPPPDRLTQRAVFDRQVLRVATEASILVRYDSLLTQTVPSGIGSTQHRKLSLVEQSLAGNLHPPVGPIETKRLPISLPNRHNGFYTHGSRPPRVYPGQWYVA